MANTCHSRMWQLFSGVPTFIKKLQSWTISKTLLTQKIWTYLTVMGRGTIKSWRWWPNLCISKLNVRKIMSIQDGYWNLFHKLILFI